jgi:hypothetical protein
MRWGEETYERFISVSERKAIESHEADLPILFNKKIAPNAGLRLVFEIVVKLARAVEITSSTRASAWRSPILSLSIPSIYEDRNKRR